MSTSAPQRSGFTDPVRDAQRTFRAALAAMSRPTLPQSVPAVVDGDVRTPAPLSAVVGALLLAMCDDYTPVWLDAPLRESNEVCDWLRFHTAAQIVDDPAEGMFVVASGPATAPALHALAQGSDEAPHQSATLIIDTMLAEQAKPVTATGPGVNGRVDWDGVGLPEGFLAQWQENRARFPRGVDVFFADATTLRALPRTTALISSDASPTQKDA